MTFYCDANLRGAYYACATHFLYTMPPTNQLNIVAAPVIHSLCFVCLFVSCCFLYVLLLHGANNNNKQFYIYGGLVTYILVSPIRFYSELYFCLLLPCYHFNSFNKSFITSSSSFFFFFFVFYFNLIVQLPFCIITTKRSLTRWLNQLKRNS